VVFWLDDISAKDKKLSYLVVVFCFGDISAEDDDPKVANPSSPIMQGDPVSIEDAAGDTCRQKNKTFLKGGQNDKNSKKKSLRQNYSEKYLRRITS